MPTNLVDTPTHDWLSGLCREAEEWKNAGLDYANRTLKIHENVLQMHGLICADMHRARTWSKSPDTFSDDQVERAVMTSLVQSVLGSTKDDGLIDFLLMAPRFEDDLWDYLSTEKGRRLMVIDPLFR